MDKVKILSNSINDNHKDYILNCFENADEAWLATAFLKSSGLNLLLPSINKHLDTNKPLKIVTGQNFGLTEPKALRELHDLFEKKSKSCLYLDKAEDKQKVFHPKLFMFRIGDKGIIISGSANITNGGLTGNEEFSICIETTITNVEWKEAISYFNQLVEPKKADLVTLLIINRYQQFYNEQKIIRGKQKSIPDKKTSDFNFDYKKLKARLKVYRNAGYEEDLNLRSKNYNKAKLLLDEIVNTEKLPQRRFEEIIDDLVGKKGTAGLWRSGSLLRLRFDVYKGKKQFTALVKFIKENQTLPASKVFNEGKKLVHEISGAGMNYVTEIMMTYQSSRFANLNSNPIKVLKEEAGVYYKSQSIFFNGDDYQEYCLVITEICNNLEFKNML